jgi:hypothetical protein
METNFTEAQLAFEQWIFGMASADENHESTQMVYGLVAVGIYLIGHCQYEQFRSDLMGIYGLDWFAVNAEAWRDAKSLIYYNISAPTRAAM